MLVNPLRPFCFIRSVFFVELLTTEYSQYAKVNNQAHGQNGKEELKKNMLCFYGYCFLDLSLAYVNPQKLFLKIF